MATPEGKVKARIKVLLKKYGIYQHWPVLNGMGDPTLDCNACVGGYYFTIEAKAPGKRPTARQQITMGEVSTSRGFVFVVADDADLLRLECYLQLILLP